MRRARRLSARGHQGKIVALREAILGDDGVAAECVIEALGTAPDTESGYARAMVGALEIVTIARELRTIRKILIRALSK